jgi:hypothetical protein
MIIRMDSPHLSRRVVSPARNTLCSRVAGGVRPGVEHPRGLTGVDAPDLVTCLSTNAPIRSSRGQLPPPILRA